MKAFFYGHAAGLGAGHFVRSLRLAEAAQQVGFEVMVTWPGSALESLNRHHIPLLSLPPIEGLATDLALVKHRSQALLEFLSQWKPDHVVVDTLPFGHGGELVDTLNAAAQEGWPTRFWWGLPYAEAKVGELRNPRLKKALARYYGMLVYTEADSFDPVPAYAAFGLPKNIHHVGMVTETITPNVAGPKPLLACLVGSGGLAGSPQLLAAICQHRPQGVSLRYIAGPLASPTPEPSGLQQIPEAELNVALLEATAVVSRVGYNTAYSLMRSDLPVLFVPTTWPEQFQRARQLAQLEGVLVLTEEQLATELQGTLQRLLSMPRNPRRLPFRVDGAHNCADLLLSTRASHEALI